VIPPFSGSKQVVGKKQAENRALHIPRDFTLVQSRLLYADLTKYEPNQALCFLAYDSDLGSVSALWTL
jgi:hypothetical protein